MSHSCSAFPATREKADSIPNRGTFSHSPRSSSQSYHLLTQKRVENRTGITKTVLEKAEPPPRCSQTGRENPQCSYKSAESSNKGPVFSPSHGHAATSQIHQHSTGAGTGTGTGTPAPSRAAGPLPGEGQHHAQNTHTIRTLLQLPRV